MSSRGLYNTRRRRQLYGPGPTTRRSTFGYWVPLALTVTVATAGLAAWIWSERQDGEEDSREAGGDEVDNDVADCQEDGGIHGQRSTTEVEGGEGYARESEAGVSDRGRQSEEVGERVKSRDVGRSAGVPGQQARRTVAVVVSAESWNGDIEGVNGDASILSHLSRHHDASTTKLFVLIYAPHRTSLPSQAAASHSADDNLPNPIFDALHAQASALVDRPSMVLPFTTPTGYIHLLRHLAPSWVYVADSKVVIGAGGENVAQLKGWVGQTVVVVAGKADHGDGSALMGHGKSLEVVDVSDVGDDWDRRISGRS